jgi:hypothetical protein
MVAIHLIDVLNTKSMNSLFNDHKNHNDNYNM